MELFHFLLLALVALAISSPIPDEPFTILSGAPNPATETGTRTTLATEASLVLARREDRTTTDSACTEFVDGQPQCATPAPMAARADEVNSSLVARDDGLYCSDTQEALYPGNIYYELANLYFCAQTDGGTVYQYTVIARNFETSLVTTDGPNVDVLFEITNYSDDDNCKSHYISYTDCMAAMTPLFKTCTDDKGNVYGGTLKYECGNYILSAVEYHVDKRASSSLATRDPGTVSNVPRDDGLFCFSDDAAEYGYDIYHVIADLYFCTDTDGHTVNQWTIESKTYNSVMEAPKTVQVDILFEITNDKCETFTINHYDCLSNMTYLINNCQNDLSYVQGGTRTHECGHYILQGVLDYVDTGIPEEARSISHKSSAKTEERHDSNSGMTYAPMKREDVENKASGPSSIPGYCVTTPSASLDEKGLRDAIGIFCATNPTGVKAGVNMNETAMLTDNTVFIGIYSADYDTNWDSADACNTWLTGWFNYCIVFGKTAEGFHGFIIQDGTRTVEMVVGDDVPALMTRDETGLSKDQSVVSCATDGAATHDDKGVRDAIGIYCVSANLDTPAGSYFDETAMLADGLLFTRVWSKTCDTNFGSPEYCSQFLTSWYDDCIGDPSITTGFHGARYDDGCREIEMLVGDNSALMTRARGDLSKRQVELNPLECSSEGTYTGDEEGMKNFIDTFCTIVLGLPQGKEAQQDTLLKDARMVIKLESVNCVTSFQSPAVCSAYMTAMYTNCLAEPTSGGVFHGLYYDDGCRHFTYTAEMV